MSPPATWEAGDGESTSKDISTHKLYDEDIPEGFPVADAGTLSPRGVLLSDKWKYMVASLSLLQNGRLLDMIEATGKPL